MEGTFWAFMPAIIAIVLALVTKQVYISLFTGIFVGAMMYAGGNPLKALFTLYQVMSEKVGANTPIIVFLVVLGILVVLMQKSGGAKAYGEWAGKKIKSKGGALAATAGLGCLIFVDDYHCFEGEHYKIFGNSHAVDYFICICTCRAELNIFQPFHKDRRHYDIADEIY